MELRLKERVREDHVKKGERCYRQVDQKKSKLVGVLQQYDEGWEEPSQRGGKKCKPRGKVMEGNESITG